MNETTIKEFFDAYSQVAILKTPFRQGMAEEMIISGEDQDGWVEWKMIRGTLQRRDYRAIEEKYNLNFPESFMEWHMAYHFFECETPFVRLPESNPKQPLEAIAGNLDWAALLIKQKLYPFADEGNDTGPLVFDAREAVEDNEFPIRVYDHEYIDFTKGLGPVIFSSFTKLIECMTHYFRNIGKKPKAEIIEDFFSIDPAGAGTTGVGYWKGWMGMLRN
ncbi:MAG: hypothetical protein E6767_02625 [Dysgonomonas sp.]|nr:hypothetical protein [Dysgonomonas sp.]